MSLCQKMMHFFRPKKPGRRKTFLECKRETQQSLYKILPFPKELVESVWQYCKEEVLLYRHVFYSPQHKCLQILRVQPWMFEGRQPPPLIYRNDLYIFECKQVVRWNLNIMCLDILALPLRTYPVPSQLQLFHRFYLNRDTPFRIVMLGNIPHLAKLCMNQPGRWVVITYFLNGELDPNYYFRLEFRCSTYNDQMTFEIFQQSFEFTYICINDVWNRFDSQNRLTCVFDNSASMKYLARFSCAESLRFSF